MDTTGKPLTKRLIIKEEEFQHTFDAERQEIINTLGYKVDIGLLKRYNVILAGGALLSCLTGKGHEINDWDLFCPTSESYTNLNKHLTSKKFNNRFVSKYAHTWNGSGMTLQSIYNEKIKFTTAEELINRFDFTICQIAYDFNKDKFTFGTRFWSDLVKKQIVVNSLDNPITCLFRIKKYESKQFIINKVEHLKVVMAVSMLKVNTVEELQQQFEQFYLVNIPGISNLDPKEEVTIDKILGILETHREQRYRIDKGLLGSSVFGDSKEEDLPF